MKFNFRKLISVSLAILLISSILGCSSHNNVSKKTDGVKQGEVVKIVFPWTQIGKSIGANYFAYTVKTFNEKFKGKYEMVVEEVPGEVPYIDKLKLLNAADNLPAIFDLGRDPSLAKIIIDNHKVVDLKPYIDAAPEWKKVLMENSIAYNTVDGKIIGTPAASDSYVGIFYNKELFAQAGITQFPQTWEEFWAACEKLKAKGIMPISLHTTETGWSPNLMLSAMIGGGSKEGMEFMKTHFPVDFEKEYFINASKNIAKLFTYSTSDAVGGTYAMASNNFVSGKTAMMPNGPWMIDTFLDPKAAPKGFIDKVGVGLYPGKVTLSNEGMKYGFAVAANQPKKVQEGAIEYLKLINSEEIIRRNIVELGGLSKAVPLTAEDKAKLTKPASELADLVAQPGITVVPRFQQYWDSAVQNEAIPKELPLLASGQITAEEYAKRLTETAKNFAKNSTTAK